MSVRRLAVTIAVMAGIAALLLGLAPSPATVVHDLAAPQQLVGAHGPEALLVAATAALAWAIWAWGLLGLLLAAAGALPGAFGALARLAQRVLIPATGRRAAALVLGIGVGLAGPGSVALAADDAPAGAASASTGAPVPDWPTAAVPDWPAAPAPTDQPTGPPIGQPTGPHVVVHGECLWHISGAWLQERTGRTPTNAEIAADVGAWWQGNAAVIGSDPDRILPGQVLRPPEGP